jgi:tetratricopeptide (TPR) repeat protein
MKKEFLLPLAALLAFGSISFGATINVAQIENAKNSFDNGNFVKAIEIYETIINVEKVNNPYIYYNLSNAYYRNGNLAKAALNIYKAARLAPRDKDIKNNLEFIQALLAKTQGQSLATESFFISWFNVNEATVFASVFFIALLICFAVFNIKKIIIFKKIAIISSVIFALSLIFLIAKIDYQSQNNAIILTATSAKNSPSDEAGDFVLSEGTLVKLILQSGDWSYIGVQSEGRKFKGWVENTQIGKI